MVDLMVGLMVGPVVGDGRRGIAARCCVLELLLSVILGLPWLDC